MISHVDNVCLPIISSSDAVNEPRPNKVKSWCWIVAGLPPSDGLPHTHEVGFVRGRRPLFFLFRVTNRIRIPCNSTVVLSLKLRRCHGSGKSSIPDCNQTLQIHVALLFGPFDVSGMSISTCSAMGALLLLHPDEETLHFTYFNILN